MNCILNVTDHEFDQILQLNHDSIVWSTADRFLMDHLSDMIGYETVEEMCKYDACRMEKHDDVIGPRLERGPDYIYVPTRDKKHSLA